ncbi:unnamed protein product [Prunus armeniaca]
MAEKQFFLFGQQHAALFFSSRVLPVYVFDLDYSMLLLLDRYHQSVAFKDRTTALQSGRRTHRIQGSLSDRLLVRFYRACGECHQAIGCGALGTILLWWITHEDAARRNVLLTSLNYSITSAVDVLESIAAHDGERKLLHVEFIQR